MMKKMVQIDEKTILNNLINLKQIVFEVTEKCNLKCEYCGLSERLYQVYDYRKNRDMPFKKAKSIIDYLLNLWNENKVQDTSFRLVVGFYGGEPLINSSLIRKIIDYFEQLKIESRKIQYTMTTNAVLMDKYMDFLVEKNFILFISLDGDENAQSYRLDHSGKNSFEQIIHNVKLLRVKHPDYFEKSVNFTSVLHNRNDVEPIYHFFKRNFGKVPKIYPLNTSGISENKKEEFRKMYQNVSQSLMKATDCETFEKEYFLDLPRGYWLSKYLYALSGNIFLNYNHLLTQNLVNSEIYTGTCMPFSNKMFISSEGKILPCERIDSDFVMGYAHEDHVELDYKYVAEQHNCFLTKCANQCMRCATNMFCPKCIYTIDDIRDKSPHCINFCTKEAFDKDSEKIFDSLRKYPHYYDKILSEVNF